MSAHDKHHPSATGAHAEVGAVPPHPIKLCVMATVDLTIQNLCRGRLEYLISRGYEITVVCAPTPLAGEIRARGVKLFTPNLTRAMSPLTDVQCLWQLDRFFRREQFDVIEVSTPKAALLGAIAARWAGGARVVHLLRGLAYQRQRFFSALVMRWAQRIPCLLADRVIAVSPSLRERAIHDRMAEAERIVVLGSGSSNGVDTERYAPRLRAGGAELRRRYGIPESAVVVGFVARLTGDKGVAELVEAFAAARDGIKELYLLMVGEYEQRDRPPRGIVEQIERDDHIVRTGWQRETGPYYGAMDILVLPSRREGFGNVLLEAGAVGLPVIATDIEGCRDAVRPGATGLLVPLQSVEALREGIERLAADPALRAQMGAAARAWIVEHFDQRKLWEKYDALYREMVAGTR